jgi:hypothetical protein
LADADRVAWTKGRHGRWFALDDRAVVGGFADPRHQVIYGQRGRCAWCQLVIQEGPSSAAGHRPPPAKTDRGSHLRTASAGHRLALESLAW